jgi:hypothetical protein
MAISTYAELVAAVTYWSHRDDDVVFAARIADFVKLAEARFNRALRTTDMEATLASTALVDGAASLPSGFLAFKELRFDGDTSYTLQAKPLEFIRAQDTTSTGNALYFAVTGSQVVCWPPTGPIAGTYYTEIPNLQDNSTNWLLTSHPDLYLFAALTEAALFTQDDSRIPLWAEKASALLDAVKRADDKNQFDGGVLAVRAR